MITIKQLSKTYKTGKAGLSPINLQVADGKIIALAGANGAGKSTLIQLLTGILTPTSGTVEWGGKTFSYMPDDIEFPSYITASEWLKLLCDLKNVSSEKIAFVLQQVGLCGNRAEKISTFSKGMKQRLCFAQTLLADEEVLILDEPTNGLDPFWLQQMSEQLASLRSEGKTIIFSTHDMPLVEKIADEMLFFQDGKVVFHSTKQQWSTQQQSLEQLVISQLQK